MIGLMPLEEEEETPEFLSLYHVSTQQEDYLNLDLGLLASITVRNKCLLFKIPIYGILLQQPELTETLIYVLHCHEIFTLKRVNM